QTGKPVVFLCHSSDDKPLAERIATDFLSNGIDTFFDKWSIGPGDSLRRKIDEGLEDCTHFVALLTLNSIERPWVQTEMDAAFVRKVNGKCRFISVRSNLEANRLPPLLSGIHSPELVNYEKDIQSLIAAIHGVSNKPKIGEAPHQIQQYSGGATGLSP